MDEWRGLPEDVKSLVQGVFGNAQRLQARIEDESDARVLLLQVAGTGLAEEVLSDMAAALVKWTVENAASFKRARTRVFQERACFLPASSSGSAWPADVYDQLVSSDIVLLRKVHHSRLSQKLADAGNEKKREALEEGSGAGNHDPLPACCTCANTEDLGRYTCGCACDFVCGACVYFDWVEGGGMSYRQVLCRHCPDFDPNRMCDREALVLVSNVIHKPHTSFTSSRRSPWPFSVANLIDYLDEKFEAGSMAKSVLGAIAASLSVLEVVGKVADEDLISTDSLW